MSSTVYFSEISGTGAGSTVQLWKYTNGTATLVRQTNTGPNWNFDLVTAGGHLYFEAWTSAAGYELWTSDGTPAGTYMVADIQPGSNGSYPSNLVSYKGQVVFSAVSLSTNGEQLYISNGLASGTVPLQPAGDSASAETVIGNYIYFDGYDPVHGSELWVSDGTSQGTNIVQDLNPGTNPGGAAGMTYYNGYVYFQAQDGVHGYQLYRTPANGATNQVSLVNLINSSGSAYPGSLIVAGANMFFVASDGADGTELWTTNGSLTYMVKDIAGGSASSYPYSLTSFGGECYFVATDGFNGDELWRSNGASIGTQMVSTTFSSSTASAPSNLTVIGSTLYFAANDGTHGEELWSYTAGASAPTAIFNADGTGNSYINTLTNINGTLYFYASANNGASFNLYKTTGTYLSTMLVGAGVEYDPGTLAVINHPVNDFNDDGLSDIAFQSTDSSVAVWEMNGASIQTNGAAALATPGTGWSLIGSGDFFNDGTADLLLQNVQNGALAYWGINQGASGPTLDTSETLQLSGALNPGPNWHAVATGDFNNDGHADIAFQNTDSSVAVWEMNGASLATNGAAILGVPGANWHLRATGDFFGEGTYDLLMQRDDGALAVWGINQSANGPTFNMTETAQLSLNPGSPWVVKGTGDFNGDGKSDIVFQNAQSGDVAIWEMNGVNLLSPSSAAVIASPGTTWSVKSIGEYNGDGLSDILLQNSQNGALAMWFMSGLSLLPSSTQLAANAGTTWTPAA